MHASEPEECCGWGSLSRLIKFSLVVRVAEGRTKGHPKKQKKSKDKSQVDCLGVQASAIHGAARIMANGVCSHV